MFQFLECEADISDNCSHENFHSDFELCVKPLKSRPTFAGAAMGDDGGPLILHGRLAGMILHGKHEDEDQCHESTILLNIRSYLNFIFPKFNMS